MSRRRDWLRFSPPNAVVPRRAAARRAQPARRRRTFQFERLEDRLTMNGDNPLAVGSTMPPGLDVAAVADFVVPASATRSAAADELPSTFQSAAEFESWLVEAAVAQWGNLFGKTTHYPGPYRSYGYEYFSEDVSVMPVVLRANQASFMTIDDDAVALNGSVLSTNVQVDGVDEADLIETDGEYLYILSDNDLVIVQAGIGDDLEVLSRIHLDGRPVGMYLNGDRLAIVSSSGGTSNYGGTISGIRPSAIYNMEYYGGPPTTTVTVLDVANRTAPSLVQKSQMDGALVASRVVDGQLRLVLSGSPNLPAPIARKLATESSTAPVVQNPKAGLLAPKAIPNATELVAISNGLLTIDSWYPTGRTEYVYESQAEYLARVKDGLLESAMPCVRTLGVDGEVLDEQTLVAATDVYRPESLLSRSLTTIATFDLSSNQAGPADTACVFTQNISQVYANADSIYLFSRAGSNAWTARGLTAIHKFDFNSRSHGVKLVAKGEIEGTLLNQFAADEHAGYLRVVTSSSKSAGQSVSVLQQVGHRLKVVGSVEGLAPGELIYSVRFMGERAFLVTFHKVDPLFAIDLSDPTNPQVLGELKIPGYSDYLQPIDENHLLAVGRGGSESSVWFQELQVSIFDTSDMSEPVLVDRFSFDGGRSTATPVTGDRWMRGDGDHHAVSYFSAEQIFAIPILSADAAGSTRAGIDNTPIFEQGHGGLQVFRIDVDSGITPIGLIQHDMLVERSVQIGEDLYAISSDTVTVHELTDPTVELGSVTIASQDDASYTELTMYRSLDARAVMMANVAAGAKVLPTNSGFDLPKGAAPRATQSVRRVTRGARETAFAADSLLLMSRIGAELSSEPVQTALATPNSPAEEVDADVELWGLADDCLWTNVGTRTASKLCAATATKE
jgi:uncharacterized secreted protein with C-terminal beta-propeller domain